ncbi:MAG TPA: hypothetical protein DGR79_06400 [Clostridiales bacterium]|nr:hypothetical protein [Clostridiales bacterium]
MEPCRIRLEPGPLEEVRLGEDTVDGAGAEEFQEAGIGPVALDKSHITPEVSGEIGRDKPLDILADPWGDADGQASRAPLHLEGRQVAG